MIVVSDTTTIHYLVLIEVPFILERLFGRVILPEAVARELRHARTPPVIREFLTNPPAWLMTRTPVAIDPNLPALGDGELQAISLALELHADLLLTDDRVARIAAESRNIVCSGTLGVLQRAAELNLLDYQSSIAALRRTTLRIPKGL